MRQIIYVNCILILTLISCMSFSLAEDADYVYINEGEQYIWQFAYEEDNFEDYWDDLEDQIGADLLDHDPDIEALKWIIEDVEDKEDDYPEGDGFKIEMESYETEEFGQDDKWKKDRDFDSTIIYEFHHASYAPRFIVFDVEDLLISIETNWQDVADELSTFDSWLEIEEITVDNAGNGLIIEIVWSDMSVQETTFSYNSNGVLDYIELNYDGESILTVQLQPNISGYSTVILFFILFGSIGSIIYNYLRKVRKR